MQVPLAEGILGISSGEVALLISGVALVFALRRWRLVSVRNRAVRQQGLAAPSDGGEAARGQGYPNPLSTAELTAEMSALLAELEETTRRVSAQMSNRRTALELLVKEADEKIRELEALTRGTAGAGVAGGKQTGKGGALGSAAPDPAQTLSRLRQQRGRRWRRRIRRTGRSISWRTRGRIRGEIAQTLGRQPGEVELILALRAKQRV